MKLLFECVVLRRMLATSTSEHYLEYQSTQLMTNQLTEIPPLPIYIPQGEVVPSWDRGETLHHYIFFHIYCILFIETACEPFVLYTYISSNLFVACIFQNVHFSHIFAKSVSFIFFRKSVKFRIF